MPPKQKGQNVRGRDKIFRNAVEHVHIGVGHAVLGNLSLELAAGPPPSTSLTGSRRRASEFPVSVTTASAASGEPTTASTSAVAADLAYRTTLQQQQQQAAALLADRPAFYLELNAQLLSHTSKDFKKFRWEVLELCETRPLFMHHRYEIAKKLLDCLLDRSSGAFSNRSKSTAVTKGGDDAANRGETSEAFEAFARLTTAFVRDTKADFFPFYAVFQEALQAGLFDRNGHMIGDANRLQLVYSVQAAWCRELAPYWEDAATGAAAETATTPDTSDTDANSDKDLDEEAGEEDSVSAETRRSRRKLVQHILRIYVRQLHDTKEYIRRLGAEWLAYLCRLCRPMVPLVCELASADVLNGFEAEALAEVRAAIAEAEKQHRGLDSDADAADADGAASEQDAATATDSENDEDGDAQGLEDDAAAYGSQIWTTERVQGFLAQDIPIHPVVDGLGYFAAELFRGMRGSLSTSFEYFYASLLESFLLLSAEEKAKIRNKLQQSGVAGAGLVDFFGNEKDDTDSSASDSEDTDAAGKHKHKGTARKPTATRTLHGDAWSHVFSNASGTVTVKTDNGIESAVNGGSDVLAIAANDKEGATCVTPDAIFHAQLLVREVGASALQSAMNALLGETKKHSLVGAAVAGAGSDEEEEDGDEHDDASGEDGDEESSDSAEDDMTSASAQKRQAAKLARRKTRMMLRGDAAGSGKSSIAASHTSESTRPSHRLLQAVVMCLQAHTAQHLRILASLLNGAHYFLWNDPREKVLLEDIGTKLRKAISQAGKRTSLASTSLDSRRATLSFLAVAGALLELLYPLCATPYFDLTPGGNAIHNYNNSAGGDEKTRNWLMDLQKAFLPAAKECVSLVSRIAYTERAAVNGESDHVDIPAAARSLLFAFAQDVLQKNFAFCLADERRQGEKSDILYGAESDADESEDDELVDPATLRGGRGRRRSQHRRRTHGDGDDADREDAYVEEEEGGVASHPRGAQTTVNKKGRRTSATTLAKSEIVVMSTLTPLALTLVHAVCLSAWSAADAQLASPSTCNDNGSRAVTLVDEAVLLARLTLDRTRHMQSCPMQQLLRLVSQKTKEQKSLVEAKSPADTPHSAGAEMVKVVEHLLQHLVTMAEEATRPRPRNTPPSTHGSSALRLLRARALDWLAAALPLLSVFVTASPAAKQEAIQPVIADMKNKLLAILRNIKADADAKERTNARTSATEATSTRYALYARISVFLVTLATAPKARKAKGKQRTATHSEGSAHPAAHAEESMRHVSETIAILARGFLEQQQQYPREQVRSPAPVTPSPEVEDADADALAMVSSVPTEENRARLFQAAELLLGALLTATDADGASLLEREEREFAHRQQRLRQKPKTGLTDGAETKVPPATRTVLSALAKLHDTLSQETQRQLVEVILFESLTAPSQSLRVLALRLLRLLCHPHTTPEKRFAGVANAIEPSFFDALLGAEQFNPLSQTGNLDGVRQALAKLSFAAEAGTVTNPLERVVLARAMIGLLYMKFADAWPIAVKILCGLIRQERTNMLRRGDAVASINEEEEDTDSFKDDASGAEEERLESADVEGGQQSPSTSSRQGTTGSKKLDPVVWDTVMCRYTHLLVFGDVLSRELMAAASAEVHADSDTVEGNAQESEDDATTQTLQQIADSFPDFCFYHIRLTNFQRHQKGELVSKTFSVAQYIGSPGGSAVGGAADSGGLVGGGGGGGGAGFALVDVVDDDDEVIHWGTHSSYLLTSGASSSTASGKTNVATTGSPATDRATVAKTFLGALEDIMKTSANIDRKLRLVEDLVLELVAVQRSEHAGSSANGRRLDDRLALTMRACSVAPTTALTAQMEKRLPSAMVAKLSHRNGRLAEVFLSYISDANGKLQRAALDNLKRLKVEPFATYHAQLVPYSADMKTLFNFLSSFHVETDIPAHTQADYTSCALSIALPKLIANLPKEKRRDQAVLRRRLMSFITHLSDRMASTGDGDGMAQVLDGLVQRLVFCRVTSVARGTDGAKTKDRTLSSQDHLDNTPSRLTPEEFDFPALWRRWITSTLATHGAASRCTRQLERLSRQLLSTVQLLESFLHAVGSRFASYVPSCLHLALQSYLVACKQELRRPLDDAMAADEGAAEGFARHVQRALSASSLSSSLAQLRRASLAVVAQLFEQFPEDVMAALETSPNLLYRVSGREPIFSRYVQALYSNARGVTHDAGAFTGAANGGGDGRGASVVGGKTAKSYVTPVLRLMSAWAQNICLLPLFVLYPDVVVGTFGEVFAVATGGAGASRGAGPAHRAPSQALHQGLSCLNELLAMRDEVLPVAYLSLNASPVNQKRGGTSTAPASSKTSTTTTTTIFGNAFLAPHVVPIFTSIFHLVVRGADADTAAAGAGHLSHKRSGAGDEDDQGAGMEPHGGSRNTGAPSVGGASARTAAKKATRSILSFKVTMWKELMQTTSLLSRYMTENRDITQAAEEGQAGDVGGMLSKLAEVALHVVTHPACVADSGTALVALDVVDRLLREVPQAQFSNQHHLQPLVHLLNVITLPESRLKVCRTVKYVLEHRITAEDADARYGPLPDDHVLSIAAFQAQFAAVGRAISCLNSFDEGNVNLSRYDFELRYHTFHSLIHFFNNKGNYGALAANSGGRRDKHKEAHPEANSEVAAEDSGDEQDEAHQEAEGTKRQQQQHRAVRKERYYSGELDVRIPLDSKHAPVLSVEAFYALAANAIFFLRDPESTVRALAVQLLQSMLRYAVSAEATTPSPTSVRASKYREDSRYAQLILREVVRRELLPSLRRGVVSKDVNIRTDHMIAFGALGRYYPVAFPSFAALYSPNTEQNFFLNVGHVQPKCRLHALAILRKEAPSLHVRDLLRVFIPFLLTAVKDFAQGKRDLRNLTEAKAKGYCDAVLTTVAAITQKLPWEAYHRVLTLFLANASANPALRMPMLRGVVQVLNNFTFLDDEEKQEEEGSAGGGKNRDMGGPAVATKRQGTAADTSQADDDEEEEEEDAAALDGLNGDAEDAEAAQVAAAVRERRRRFRHQKITHVLEQDILPQLFEFIGDGEKKNAKKSLGLMTTGGEFKGNQHSVTAIRRAQQKEDKAAANTKNAILQLPVAMAITKIVKKFPEERFNFYVDHILDEVVLKLRTKNDKHRDSARRILGALLRETGPGKLRFVLTKLMDNLVHGYQLHVLGYTVVTLLYQLYEPHSTLLSEDGKSGHRAASRTHRSGKRAAGGGDEEDDDEAANGDPVLAAMKEAKRRRQQRREQQQQKKKQRQGSASSNEDDDSDGDEDGAARKRRRTHVDPHDTRTAAERDADDELEAAEEELLAHLMPYYHGRKGEKHGGKGSAGFDHAYGIACLMDNLDGLMRIFLDDYLGEVGMQKEQTELMSTMVEVKRNRALQGFSFLARHCEASRIMEVFLQKITWVLTPPTDAATTDAAQLHGSERARVLLMQEMKSKYLTVNKNSAGADLVFVEKVRLLATRIARGLMSNPSMHVDNAFAQVRDLLDRHNAVREAKIRAFEARDGTRRIRGNAHMLIQKAQHDSWKEQLDKNYLVEPVPERVDADFSAHTVLATQQKQKLRVYKGRYGKVVKEAARDFYREDPTTAVVLDTLDEFLMKFLLSVLKRVLGIGKEAKYTSAAVQLDLLRRKRQRKQQQQEDGDEAEASGTESGTDTEEEDSRDTNSEDGEDVEPHAIDEDGEDELDAFADAQQQGLDTKGNASPGLQGTGAAAADAAHNDESESDQEGGGEVNEDDEADGADLDATTTTSQLLKRKGKKAKLSISFTVEYRELLESLVPSVLTTLQGEGADPVIANALDCLLALVSLRPPLQSVHDLNHSLFSTVTSFFGRGGSIKQRAMRVCAAVIAHQPFKLADDQASQLVRLVRAEIMDRSPFLPMSLSLFYAVLGKHSHVVEVYDLTDVITELMVHLSAKPVIVRKCIMIFVRFLTEFKLTASKFRSHIDLLCKNLDYPELTGRLALLECLDTLITRLPVVVLRHEAPVLLVPLAATITSCEWKRCRERAGRVLQNMTRLAGIDVLAPILSGWLMGEKTTRPQRTMAAQVWATMLPALAKAYHLPEAGSTNSGKPQRSTGNGSTASEEEQEAYQASCEWSLPGVLDGCLFDQFKAAGVRIHQTKAAGSSSETRPEEIDVSGVSKKDRARAELKGWTLVFYSLRCAEAVLVALPDVFYPVLGPRLLPAITGRLMTHTHPWVQAVAMRILRHYLYVYVETRCLFLQEAVSPYVASVVSLGADVSGQRDGVTAEDGEAPGDNGATVEEDNGEEETQLPNLLPALKLTPAGQSLAKQLRQGWLPSALYALEEHASLLKGVLSRVGLSDVANEQQQANRVLEGDATRTESLKVLVYLSKALSHTAVSILVATKHSPKLQRQAKVLIEKTYASLFRHVHALVKPMLDQRAITNYLVRSATLVQFFGGFVSVLPQLPEADDEETSTGTIVEVVQEVSAWLLTSGMHALSFIQRTVRPLLSIAFVAGRHPQQRLLMNYTHQAANVIKVQLEERRSLFSLPGGDTAAERNDGRLKRPRDGREAEDDAAVGSVRKAEKRSQRAAATDGAHRRAGNEPMLDTVLTEITAGLAAVREEKREQKIVTDTKRHLKRQRHELDKDEQRKRRPASADPSSRRGTGTGGKTKMAIKKKFGGRVKRR